MSIFEEYGTFKLGMHCLLRPNMEIDLHGYFAKNFWFPCDSVDPD